MLLFLPYFPCLGEEAAGGAEMTGAARREDEKPAEGPPGYTAYAAQFSEVPYITETLEKAGTAYDPAGTTATVREREGALEIAPDGQAAWNVTVEKTGFYRLAFRYKSVTGSTSAMEREILVDGALPFKEAQYVALNRTWSDVLNEGKFETDISGNDRKPGRQEADIWQIEEAADSSGYIGGALYFYLDEGTHQLALNGGQGTLLLERLILGGYRQLPTYGQVRKGYQDKGYQPAQAEPILMEAEFPALKSDMSIYPLNDKSSAITSPQSPTRIRLNTIGASKWQKSGQWIAWTIRVEKAGLYKIGCRFRQDLYPGMFVTRELRIDGEIPFQEAANLTFMYDNGWQSGYLGANGEDFEFYFVPGQDYELKLKVVLGDVSEALGTLEGMLLELNQIYRNILIITGSVPDIYRDYKFNALIPETVENMQTCADIIRGVAESLEQVTGEKGEYSALLNKIVMQLELMHNKPKKIAANLEAFQSNIGALGTWVLSARNQPLELDTIFLHSGGEPLPRAEAGFFRGFAFGFQSFLSSFFNDYDTVGMTQELGASDRRIKVWTATGRDQLQVIRQLIDESFTKDSGIGVNLQLVSPGSLLPSTLAGIGPDVALSNAGSDPINFAIRGAVTELGQFSDFEEIVQRFHESAMVPYTFMGKSYALPETQSFNMMFYRKDIFEEFGLSRPETWDDYYALIPQLQKNNMQLGFPLGLAGLLVFFGQTGEDLYRDNGASCNLDTDAGLDSFKKQCDLFTQYDFPREYDFPNRFRTGEMPIGIADYTVYNTLTVFAPEIRGLWEMVQVPGTVREDGTVDHSVMSGGLSVMMMEAAQDKEASWDFMKWWTSADTQSRYALEMESILGPSAKHPSANMESFQKMSWSATDYAHIMEQWESVKGIPEVPGGYFTSRNVEFAFVRVYNKRDNPTEVLLDYIPKINHELNRKRKEFGIG